MGCEFLVKRPSACERGVKAICDKAVTGDREVAAAALELWIEVVRNRAVLVASAARVLKLGARLFARAMWNDRDENSGSGASAVNG